LKAVSPCVCLRVDNGGTSHNCYMLTCNNRTCTDLLMNSHHKLKTMPVRSSLLGLGHLAYTADLSAEHYSLWAVCLVLVFVTSAFLCYIELVPVSF